MVERKEKIGSELVSLQPQTSEIVGAFALFVNIPNDEELTVKGLKAASAKAPFLGRFIGPDNKLTQDWQEAVDELRRTLALVLDGQSLVLNELKKGSLASQTRTFFKDKGVDALKEAAAEAQKIWSPK